MTSDIKGALQKKAVQLGLERADALKQIQGLLEAQYPGRTRAKSLHNGVLKVITPSAAVASELRLNQVRLLKQFNLATVTAQPIARLHLQIQQLD